MIFFTLVLGLYWLAQPKFRRPLLLVASYMFYMSWIPTYAVLIAGLTAVNYLLAYSIDRWRAKSKGIFFAGIAFVDTQPDFAEAAKTQQLFFNAHFRPAGHKVVADAMLKQVAF